MSPLTLQTLGEDTFIALPRPVTHKFFGAGQGQGSKGLGVWGQRSPGCEICPSCVNRGQGEAGGGGAAIPGGKTKHRREKLDTICEKIPRGEQGRAETINEDDKVLFVAICIREGEVGKGWGVLGQHHGHGMGTVQRPCDGTA